MKKASNLKLLLLFSNHVLLFQASATLSNSNTAIGGKCIRTGFSSNNPSTVQG